MTWASCGARLEVGKPDSKAHACATPSTASSVPGIHAQLSSGHPLRLTTKDAPAQLPQLVLDVNYSQGGQSLPVQVLPLPCAEVSKAALGSLISWGRGWVDNTAQMSIIPHQEGTGVSKSLPSFFVY